MEEQVKSKQRVADHGEVLTSKREVNAMLDLVKQETERIESRFLEPACGTGNFLTVILERKLGVVESRYGKSQLYYERYTYFRKIYLAYPARSSAIPRPMGVESGAAKTILSPSGREFIRRQKSYPLGSQTPQGF
jgi:hypothetical protein